jgi:glycosyltransferase involved in cell wall biosynthesis
VRVVFSTAILPHYRLPFHEGVRSTLASFGITYDVIFGQPDREEALKGDLASLSWGKRVANHYFRVGRTSFLWQPILSDVWGSDLVVVGQENRLLTNYVIQGLRRFRRPKIALWGHGRNFQSDPRPSVRDRWKRVWATQCDWWFAYTEASRKIVETYGFPTQRITVFQNAIDISEIRRLIAQIDDQRLESLRKRLRVNSANVAIYVGGIYPAKRVDFLIKAAREIRQRVPDFMLVVVGDGVHRSLVETAAAEHSWIRYLGPLFGAEKAEILRLGRVFMMPGLVGLAILDCAAAGIPIVTTAYPYHSPEIAYLEPGQNGLIVADWLNPMAYADAVISLLTNDELHASLVVGARKIAANLTIERMVDCFSDGVLAALKAPRYGERGLPFRQDGEAD